MHKQYKVECKGKVKNEGDELHEILSLWWIVQQGFFNPFLASDVSSSTQILKWIKRYLNYYNIWCKIFGGIRFWVSNLAQRQSLAIIENEGQNC